jgi:hypothetical protein
MKPRTQRKPTSYFATFAIISVYAIVFIAGLSWLFFDKSLNALYVYLDEHAKAVSILVKSIVYISGIIWIAAPIFVAFCIYTLTKGHYDNRKPSIMDHIKSKIQHLKLFSAQTETQDFNPNLNERDFDNFMNSEHKKLLDDLAARSDSYLSVYNYGPLFLGETRDRFRDSMCELLDFQDEEILYLHRTLHSRIKSQINFYQMQMKDGIQNGESPVLLFDEYSNQMEDFYSDIYTEFSEQLSDLNIQLQTLSDDHLDELQNLSRMLSKY